MNCLIISCFEFYELRVSHLKKYFEDNGFNCYYLTSSFSHLQKIRTTPQIENSFFIDVINYKKNLSLRRVLSHIQFSLKAYKKTKVLNPDIIYLLIPPNYLIHLLSRYSFKKNKVLIVDIIDLWPESIPNVFLKTKFSIIFKWWSNLRDLNLPKASKIIVECEYYRNKIREIIDDNEIETLYLAKCDTYIPNTIQEYKSNLRFCYLGSINHLIDIKLILKFFRELIEYNILIEVIIIGDGDQSDYFQKELKAIGCDIKFYGKVFDEKIKMKIMSDCHYAINIMKPTVFVGLTMKSIDYFHYGIPIINNIKYDTSYLVEKYSAGFNINYEDSELNIIAKKISYLSLEDYQLMRRNSRQLFVDHFSKIAFYKRISEILDKDLEKVKNRTVNN